MADIHRGIVEKYVSRIPQGRGGAIFNHVATRTKPHVENLVNHLNTKMSGGSVGSGGSITTGGSFFPENHGNTPQSLYHGVLKLNPHKFEAIREAAAQQLGALPSSMWGQMIPDNEIGRFEAPPEEYERIIQMPNAHAAARMLDAESEDGTGGSFFSALKHAAQKAGHWYNKAAPWVKMAASNRDLISQIPGIGKYSDQIGSVLDTALKLDQTVSPFVQATLEATKEDASPEAKKKLKQMALKATQETIREKMPSVSKYVDKAADLVNDYENNKGINPGYGIMDYMKDQAKKGYIDYGALESG